MRSVIDSCQVTTPQSTRSTGTNSRPTGSGNDCLCPFPTPGGFEIFPDQEEEYFKDFKIIVEKRFNGLMDFSRSRFFVKSQKSFLELNRLCGGNYTSNDFEKTYPFFKRSTIRET